MKQIITILLIVFTSQAFAQTQTISGRVVDSKTQEGVGFTSVGIEGTFIGTMTDGDGYFELEIPEQYFDNKLYVSAVAYQNVSFNINEILGQEFFRIPLVEQTYNIDAVDVTAMSRVLFRIISNASEKVPENFYAEPIGLKFYYKEEKNGVDTVPEMREAIIQLYDESGYTNPSIKNAFTARNYRFTEVNKNFDSYSFPEGQTGFNELLDMDMARLSNTIFNIDLINDYDMQLEGTIAYEGDSAWVISYKTDKTDLAHTGDYNAVSLNGKMYVLKSNYVLVRNECIIESSSNNPIDRSLLPGANAQNDVRYHYTCTYKMQGNKYAVSYIECDKTYTNNNGEQVSYNRKADVIELEKNPQRITGRNYFENIDIDESFWNSYHSSMKL